MKKLKLSVETGQVQLDSRVGSMRATCCNVGSAMSVGRWFY